MCAIKIQLRRDIASNWATQNPILAQGEVGWEIGTNNYKIGDGTTAWNSLAYIQFGQIPNNGKLTIQKNGTTVAEFTANQSGDTMANILADTPAWGNISGTLSDQSDLNSALSGKLTTSDILNVVNSAATDKALSANMGKELNDRLNNVESRGRFLSVWIPATGLPETNPTGYETGDEYTYQRGDYYIVGTVTAGTHYKPNGSSYIVGTASTTEETSIVKENDTYIYDGTNWILQANTQQEVTFSNIAGQPTDNTNLVSALNSKQATIDSTHKVSADLVDDTNTTNKFVTAQNKTDWNNKVTKNADITGATKCKITYDSKGLVTNGADLTSTDITTALGYTPYNNTNPSGFQTNVLEGVQVNGTDLTIDVNKKVNIPLATNSVFGAVKTDNTTIQATSGVIKAKSLDGLTSTVAELNVLDGITATTTELNYTDGVTSNIQTQLNNKQATLVSGTNIKTINNNSILGSGNINSSYVTFVDYD